MTCYITRSFLFLYQDGKDRIVLSWTADKPKDLDLQLTIGNDCRIFTNQRNCSGARLDTDWKQGGSEAGDGGVETITIGKRTAMS